MKPSELLTATADLMEKNPHYRGEGAGYCPLMAMGRIFREKPVSIIAYEEAVDRLRDVIGSPIPRWNDTHHKREVIGTLRKVAAELEVKGR